MKGERKDEENDEKKEGKRLTMPGLWSNNKSANFNPSRTTLEIEYH